MLHNNPNALEKAGKEVTNKAGSDYLRLANEIYERITQYFEQNKTKQTGEPEMER